MGAKVPISILQGDLSVSYREEGATESNRHHGEALHFTPDFHFRLRRARKLAVRAGRGARASSRRPRLLGRPSPSTRLPLSCASAMEHRKFCRRRAAAAAE